MRKSAAPSFRPSGRAVDPLRVPPVTAPEHTHALERKTGNYTLPVRFFSGSARFNHTRHRVAAGASLSNDSSSSASNVTPGLRSPPKLDGDPNLAVVVNADIQRMGDGSTPGSAPRFVEGALDDRRSADVAGSKI
jgi:hypothetical protein